MNCPLCGQRKARRFCPAVGHQICTVCCGTKRLSEIRCPSDCPYLTSAREHPPAAAVRQQQRDVSLVMHLMRDFNDRQSALFVAVMRFIAGQAQPTDLQSLIDDDVVDGVEALAATFETSAKGVIYEHRAASLGAERLAGALKRMLAEAAARGGTAFERDAAVVLRRVGEAVRDARAFAPDSRRSFLEWLGRVMKPSDDDAAGRPAEAPRLIVP